MKMEEEEFSPYSGFGSGCGIHGEDFLRECTMCGIEFCSACFPNSTLCSDCAAQGDVEGAIEEETPTEEEKELLLLEGFDEDTGESEGAGVHPPVPAAKPVPAASPKPVPARAAKPLVKTKAKPAAKRQAKPKATAKAKGKPKAKAKPKVKKLKAKPRKPARPAPKAKAKSKAQKKR